MPEITLEEFRHWLINPDERGFDDRALRAPVPVPESAVREDGGPCDRVCQEAPKVLWPALKAVWYGGAFKKYPYVTPLDEALEDQGMDLSVSEQDAIDSGFVSEWPIENNVSLLEDIYEHVRTFDNLPPK